MARAGQWAEVRLVLLEPGERAPTVSDDTARLPLVARVRGFLEHDADVGASASVTTVLGRRVEGSLVDVSPPARHSFGRPQAELLAIGGELRALLEERDAPGA